MSTRILILKDGVITPSRSSGDITAINTSLGITASLALKANLVSPALTGTPTAPTATAGTNNTQIANTAFVSTAISNLVASSPAALDTLNELATALGNDANFATTITNALSLKANLNSPVLVTPNLGTPSAGILTNATGLPLSTGTTGTLPISRGGTGSATQNFVDLTNNQTIAGEKTFTGRLRATSGTNGNNAEFGSFGIQGFALNNCWLGDNFYYDGFSSGFRYTQNGTAGAVYFVNGGIELRTAVSGTAGNILTPSAFGVLGLRISTTSVSVPLVTPSTSTTTGALVVTGGQAIGENLNVGGFTSLGNSNTGLKCKVITGITAATQGGSITIGHGLDGTKIVATTGIINYSTGATVPIPGNQVNYQCTISTDTVNITITNVAGNSVGILSLPFTVLVWYRP